MSRGSDGREVRELEEIREGTFLGQVWTVAIATVVGAIAAVLALIPHSNGGGTNNNQISGGAGNCIANGGVANCAPPVPSVTSGTPSPDVLRERVHNFSNQEPTLPGPWPYLIYNTDAGGVSGLKIKQGPGLGDPQLGSSATYDVVWAECLTVNQFTPPTRPEVNVGPVWLRIRWPNNRAGVTTFFSSSKSDPFVAYAYAGYALPYGHNGDIPPC